MNQDILKNYANLLVKAGGNVQPGQLVVIRCAIEDAAFGRMVQECAYDAGASEVEFDWNDDQSSRTTWLRAADEAFETFPQWAVDKMKYRNDKGACYLHITSSNPDNLKGVDSERLRKYSMVAGKATKEESAKIMAGEQRWSVVALPSPAWAKKVFPDLSETEAVDKLWPLVLKAARADGENPIEEWKQHDENFTKNVNYLNEQQFSALRFITGLGTDITIGLVKNHRWAGGSDVAKDGIRFFPNIPTEEVFTMPHREKADGHVVASMPLSYQGNLIEDFEFTFKDGKVVSYKAKTNEHLLKNMVEMDDGAARLGEVAIVPNSSPIGQMNTLFYNTLFDENASAHLALGKAYPNNIQDGDSLPLETLIEQGGNDSLIHVDFMFGTPDMKIIGIKDDGTEICFFNHGAYL